MAKVIRIETVKGIEVRRSQDMQDSIWKTIVTGHITLPEGVRYELAPKFEPKAVELMDNEFNLPISNEEIEPIQSFTKEEVEEVNEPNKRGRKPFKK